MAAEFVGWENDLLQAQTISCSDITNMNGDYTRVPTFEYTSAFSYRSDFEPIDDYTDNDNITKYSQVMSLTLSV